ncbi:hypothetical protein LCGC14_2305090 [marine sediment metagenome]|uniref:Uncharacterized protein n=1 Tax=marine sediment metagenome TaxID=412755 RepID=A0A0F9CMB4_9ZZZZ
MNLKKVVCVLFVLVGLLMVMSCSVGQEEETDPDLYIAPPIADDAGPVGPPGPPGEIEYWEHTVKSWESTDMGNSLYYITIFDGRFELGAWYDFWQKYSDTMWFRLDTYYDGYTGNFYYMWGVGDGVVVTWADVSLIGDTLIIFKAPATAMSAPSVSGTWVNPDYDGEGYPAKAVVTDNGDGTFTAVMYETVSDTEPFDTITMTVTNQWTDSEGNLFLEVEGIVSDEVIYELIKIHADNQTMEVNISYDGYPTEIDPAGEEYQIFYRQ